MTIEELITKLQEFDRQDLVLVNVRSSYNFSMDIEEVKITKISGARVCILEVA